MEGSQRLSPLVVAFATAIFVSAFLLFQVQPLVGKQLLPQFGGSPAVWTTCLLFFQTTLFAGYLYAHVCHAWLRLRAQTLLHVVVLIAAAIAVAMWFAAPDDSQPTTASDDPISAILLTLAVSVGLPYFALAATGPLLQAWFARAFPDRVPYRLYALSNFGSLLALVSYPFVIEQRFQLPQQARLWSWGFGGFAILCGVVAARVGVGAEPSLTGVGKDTERRPRTLQYVAWLGWPAAASIVLMATTNHVCTDVAVIPFLWVAPLALYLVTFIIAFDHPRWHRPAITAALTLAAIYGTTLVHREGVGRIDLYDCGMTGRCVQMAVEELATFFSADGTQAAPPASPSLHVGFVAGLALNLVAMFGICLLCHGELVRQRPESCYLTAFYVMIAAGGALGGAAVTLLAPRLFDTFFEWTLSMFVATIGVLAMILHALVNRAITAEPSPSRLSSSLTARLTLILLLLPASLVLLDMVEYLHAQKKNVRFQQRNFFGAFTVRERNPDDPLARTFVLLHGVTVHGSQFTAPSRRGQPTTYYGTPSGIGTTLNYYRSTLPRGGLRIGSIGLGTGTLAAFAGVGDSICFYEIDRDIVDLTTSGRWFTYVRDCQARGAKCDIKLGDARVTLESEQRSGRPSRFHVLVADAFSGDAVPIHLLTTEAFELYLARLATKALDGQDGALAVHVSNRYLDLERVAFAAAHHFGIPATLVESPGNAQQSINSADWIILSHNEALMKRLAPLSSAVDEAAKPPLRWTDERSSLFEVLK
jgi:hypothetical protein